MSGFVTSLKDLVIAEVESLTPPASEKVMSNEEPTQFGEKEVGHEGDADHSTDNSTAKRKLPRFFPRYDNHTQKKKASADNTSLTAKNQFAKYLEEVRDYNSNEGRGHVFHFWADNKKKFPQLYNLAIVVLSIPASSAPVERVFSHGGILMRPHRARLGEETLSKLIFLKCNETLLD